MGAFWGCAVIAAVLYACGCEIAKGFNKIAAVIAEISKPSHNTGSPKLPQCTFCNHEILSWINRGYNYCPHCGRQLRANA